MHCDSNFLPFWLTLFTGKKTFRVVTLENFREHLTTVSRTREPAAGAAADEQAASRTVPENGKQRKKKTTKKVGGTGRILGPLYTEMGNVVTPEDAFDDATAEREFIARGATVYNATMLPGDTVYVPVGALHGGYNLPEGGIAVALTSNFLDSAHANQVLDQYCLHNRDAPEQSGICHQLANDPQLRRTSAAVLQAHGNDADGGVFPYWPWYTQQPGFCDKYSNPAANCPAAEARCAANIPTKKRGKAKKSKKSKKNRTKRKGAKESHSAKTEL